MTAQRFGSYALTGVIAALAGCGTSSQSDPNNDVMVAFDALCSAIAACGGDLATCTQAAGGDTTALQACRDAFAGCRQSAGAPAAGALGDAVVACTADARSCASSAAGEAASACHEGLVTCLGGARPTPPIHDDAADGGGSGGDHAAPVASCIDELLACVSGDGDAMACGMAVRACIIAHVPAPPGVIPEDPGSAAADAGRPDDLPEPPADAGKPDDLPEPPTPDAGMAGAPPAAPCMDAFGACIAAGGTHQSCGMALRECGR